MNDYFYEVFSLVALIPVVIVYLKWKTCTKKEKIWLSIFSLIMPFVLIMAYLDHTKDEAKLHKMYLACKDKGFDAVVGEAILFKVHDNMSCANKSDIHTIDTKNNKGVITTSNGEKKVFLLMSIPNDKTANN